MNAKTVTALASGLAVAGMVGLGAARAEPPAWRNQGYAVVIPPSAMQELLRCRHEQRPEEECYARMVRATDNAHQMAVMGKGARAGG